MSYLDQILADVEAGQSVTVDLDVLRAGYFGGPDCYKKAKQWAAKNGIEVTPAKITEPGVPHLEFSAVTFSKS